MSELHTLVFLPSFSRRVGTDNRHLTGAGLLRRTFAIVFEKPHKTPAGPTYSRKKENGHVGNLERLSVSNDSYRTVEVARFSGDIEPGFFLSF